MARKTNSVLIIITVIVIFIIFGFWYIVRFYPQQQMPIGIPIVVITPEPGVYHNDCLHPCVRMIKKDQYVMAYSPYYGWNNRIENPIVSFAKSVDDWTNGLLLDKTPDTGYNSDPCVFVADSTVYAFWRVCETPLCKELGRERVVIGREIGHEVFLDSLAQHVFLSNPLLNGDATQCPILMRHDNKYLFYAVWYQYVPTRENKGIAIWEGTSLENPDFYLRDTIRFDNPLVCDKLFQKKIGGRLWFFPIPKKYDLWHFDLFEYGGRVWMVSCAEKGDNLLLSVSDDWAHFKTFKKPLINNHYSENYTGYRQYFYKPTALIQNDTLYLFYTSNSKDDPNLNQLFLSKEAMRNLH